MLPNMAFLKCNYTRTVVSSTLGATEEQQTYNHEPRKAGIMAPLPPTIGGQDALYQRDKHRKHSGANLRQ